MRYKILWCFLWLGVTAFSVAAQGTWTATLNSTQVVPINSSPGHGSCKVGFDYNEGEYISYFNVNCEFSGLSGGLIDADIGIASVGQNTVNDFCDGKYVTVTLPNNGSGNVTISRCPMYDFWTALEKRFYVVLMTSSYPGGEVRGQMKLVTLDSDLNGEGQAEISVFRPSEGVSYAHCDLTNGTIVKRLDWQSPTDSTPFLADLDSDGIADWAYVRTDPVNGSLHTRYQSSQSGQLRGFQIGNANLGDITTFGDYDGDGTIESAVFRQTDGNWYVTRQYHEGFSWPYRAGIWGIAGDRPCTGDYDADGKTDLCVVRVEDGHLVWYIRRSYLGDTAVQWGLPTDTFYPQFQVNVDGDLTSDVLVSRDENGKRVFYAFRSYERSLFVLQWGLSTDKVKLGDYDNDGKTDFAAIREIDGHLVWFIWQSASGTMRTFQWGVPGDL